MRIIADDTVLAATEAFAPLGAVAVLPAAEITPAALRDADALIVRSGVRITPALLTGSRVRFVATATAGVDHLDIDGLQACGVAVASAPGCNAQAVADYVAAALVRLAVRQDWSPAGRTLGVVGVGQVGARVVRVGRALGMRVLECDPPRARRGEPGSFVSHAEIWAECDVVTLHVPLSESGPDATRRMIDAATLNRLRPGCILINTARGGVVDRAALIAARESGRISGLIVDVWDGEPAPDDDLLRVADLMTPHIAGYSRLGRLRGTWQAAAALARHVGAGLASLPPLPIEPVRTLEIPAGAVGDSALAVVDTIIRLSYNVEGDDEAMRRTVAGGGGAAALQRIRKNYPGRPEFSSFLVSSAAGTGPLSSTALDVCRCLGFAVRTTE